MKAKEATVGLEVDTNDGRRGKIEYVNQILEKEKRAYIAVGFNGGETWGFFWPAQLTIVK